MDNKYAIVFSGQSAQYIGMGKKIYDEYKFVRELFAEAEDILKMPISRICFEEGEFDLNKTIYTQPAVYVVDIAYYHVFCHETGYTPSFAAGHSLGEYAALTCSGALDYKSTLNILKKRAEYMDECNEKHPGEMWAIGNCNIEKLQTVLARSEGITSIGCYNTKSQNVISGPVKEVHKIIEKLQELGVYASKLNVSAAFHSSLMTNASDRLFADLIQISYGKMNFPIISNVTAKPYLNANIPEMLSRQITSPVRWKATIDYLINNGTTDIIELGPGDVLKKMLLKSKNHNVSIFSYDNESNRKSAQLQLKKENLTDSSKVTIKDYIFFINRLIAMASGVPCNLKKDVYEQTVLPKIQELRKLGMGTIQTSQIKQYYNKAIKMFEEILVEKEANEQEIKYRREKVLMTAKELNLEQEGGIKL